MPWEARVGGPISLLALVDHLVSAQQNRWGYGKAKRLGGLAVHDYLELGRKLYREIDRLLAAQDAIHNRRRCELFVSLRHYIRFITRYLRLQRSRMVAAAKGRKIAHQWGR